MLGRSGGAPSSSSAAQSWDVSLNKLNSFLTLDFEWYDGLQGSGFFSLCFSGMGWKEIPFL